MDVVLSGLTSLHDNFEKIVSVHDVVINSHIHTHIFGVQEKFVLQTTLRLSKLVFNHLLMNFSFQHNVLIIYDVCIIY